MSGHLIGVRPNSAEYPYKFRSHYSNIQGTPHVNHQAETRNRSSNKILLEQDLFWHKEELHTAKESAYNQFQYKKFANKSLG